MRIPRVGERVEIQVTGLPNGLLPEIQLSFSIDRRGGAIIVYVPGHHRGPDNCTPQYPEQVDWLDSLSKLMRASWDCQWTLYDEEALKFFLDLLDPLLENYQVLIS